jgi:predicted alpha/beta-fold hydrolase
VNMSEFTPAWFARGPHLQTAWGRLFRRRRLVTMRREILPTPDGDDLVLDHLDASSPDVHFILLHGLEGSSYSVYMQGLLAAIARAGQSATAMNFRSCARDPRRIFRALPNRRPRFYHSGETMDFDHVARTLERRSTIPIVATGVSLGGNALLKWLGENPDQNIITAAATISVPYDLDAAARHLELGSGPFYVHGFLRSLRKKVKHVLREFPETTRVLSEERALRARTFWEFDDAATGPLHGFTGADDYYARSSSIQFVSRIKTPTLCISAEDDPFLPKSVLDRVRREAAPAVEVRTTRCGGHAGFIGGSLPWRCSYWAEDMVVSWLIDRVRDSSTAEVTTAARIRSESAG